MPTARRALRLGSVTALIGITVLVVRPLANPVFADPAAGPGVFSTTATGAITAGNVPDGTCAARINAVGGAGGSAANAGAGTTAGGRGGGAANMTATFSVLPLQQYSGSVGGGGQVTRTGGVGGGGTGTDAPTDHDGAGGGGRTVVAVGGSTLVVAGGGGGAGAAHQASPAGNGGNAGFNLLAAGVAAGANGTAGQDSSGVPGGGQGGQAATGGAGGVHTTTPARNGTAGGGTATGVGGNGGTDLNYDGAGGGGAGYTGGGGGAATVGQSVTGAGGGGGSTFVAGASPVAAATAPNGVAGSATATTAQYVAGANGSMSIDWLPCLYDLTVTKTPSVTSLNAGGRIRWTIAVTNSGPDPMTRGDTLTLTDTLPSGSNATSPAPNNVVVSIATSGGSNANLQSGAVTCTGLTVGAAMPATTDCTRPYAAVAGTPGNPTGGTRGLNAGETLTIVYDQYISNTAACGTITDQATVRDRPTQNTSVPGNITGNIVTDNAAGTVTINCYDLGITKTASPNPTVAPAAAITWTITVTNNGPGNMVGPDATAANPLVVTDAFPATGVAAPTLVSSVGPAGACTLSGSTITCPGSLNAGQSQVLTFSQVVNAATAPGTTISNTATVSDPRTGDTNDSATASTQVQARPRIVLQKALGGQPRFSNADQFTMTIAGPGGSSATTTGTGSTVTGGTVTVATGTAGSTYTLSEAMAPGSVSTLGQYNSSVACTNAFATSGTVLPAGPGTSFSLVPQAGDNITCTITNTPRTAQVTVAKTSIGGIGTFDVATTNLTGAPSPVVISTATAGTPATAGPYTVATTGSQVQLTETVPAGWRLTGASCTDANSAITGNTGAFGTLVGNVLTVPGSFVEPAANITCTFTNEKLARLVIQKTANGGAGSFNFSSTGGLTPSSFALSPTVATPTQSQTFANLVPGSYTVTEAIAPPFQLTDLTCVAAGTSAPGSTVTTDAVTGVVSATLVAGADYTCTYTNVRDAQVTVAKTAIGGNDTFTFTTTGTGNPTNPAPSITTSGGVGSASFQVPFAAGVSSRTVTITESPPPAGWVLTGITCTDGAGNTVGTVAVPSVTITAAPGETFNCNFTNQRLPRVTIRKQSTGGTGTFNFTGGTNGLPPSLALNTGTANPQSSVAYQLTALNTAASITETVPTNYTLTSAVCVDGSGTPVSTTLTGSTLTIDPSAVIGGADLTCTFTNTRQSAQVRVDKRWLGAIVNDAVNITSTGGTTNPSLASVANTANEVDAGTAATVYAGETVTFSEAFTTGSAANYSTSLACTGASDTNPNDGLAITAADNGASIVCTYTNSRIPNVTKTAGAVTGPDASGQYSVTYAVTVDNPGGATSYGALTDTPTFASNLQVTGASWTTTATSGTAPAAGSATGAGPFTLAPAGTPIAAAASHAYNLTLTFRFTTYTAASACGAAGTGSYNGVGIASPETTTADNAACVPPPAPPAPSVDVQKTASPTSVDAPGTTVNYSFVVTNTGNVTLSGLVVSDPLPGISTISCLVSTLAPAASTTCTATYTVTQADIDAGAINNTATVTGTAPNGSSVNDTDVETVTATRNPAITLDKIASPSTVTAPGQTVSYSFVVANTGNVTLTAVGVTDPLPGLSAVTCPVTTLAPGASTTCTASLTTTQAQINAGAIDNTATASGTPPAGAGGPVTATDTATVTATRTPSIDINKTAAPTTVTAAGQTVSYSFVVTNTGNVTLTSVGVADPLPGLSAISCPATTLAPAASTTCTASYTVTQTDIDAGAINNTATATGTPPAGAGAPVTDTDPNTVTATNAPSISIVKTASPTTVTAAGQTVSYSFVVTNTGNVTLTAVGVTDPLPGLSAVTCPVTTLAPGASTTCTASLTTTQAQIDAGAIDNTATASGTPPTGPAVSATDSETVTANRTPSIDIVKTASPTTVTAAGQTVSYSFVVTNTGNVTLTAVGVTDPLPGLSAVTCPATTLAPGASTTCTASLTTTQAQINAGAIDNTATATGTPPAGAGGPVTATDTATVTATRTPSIDLVKAASPTTVTAAGQTVNYSFVITNTGNVTLTSVGVADPLPGLSAISCPSTALAPGASTTCTAIYTVTQADVNAGVINNVATAAGTPPAGAGGPVTDTDGETVTATRTPSIDIDKTATPTAVTAAGQTVSYSFIVTNTGNVTLTGVTVTDPLPGLSAISCPVTALAPGASTTCTASYTVTLADIDAGAINNVATAAGTPPAGSGGPVTDTDANTVAVTQTPIVELVKTADPTDVHAAGDVVTYRFRVTNVGNVTLDLVAVNDPLPGLGAVTCPATTLAPGASTTCTAAYTVTQADIDAGEIVNTATAEGFGPSGPALTDTDSAVVTAPPDPSIDIVKTADPSTVSAAGETVDYTFVVTNTGNVTLTSVRVSDPLPGLSAVSCPVTTLAPGDDTTCTATYTVTQSDVDAGGIPNTATATGSPPGLGAPVTDDDTATVSAPATPTIEIVKTANPSTVNAAGQIIAYSFEVTNTGNVTLSGVAVADPLPGLSAITCPATTLQPSASTTCTATYTATQADVNAGAIDNTATATGTPPAGPAVTDTDLETVTATRAPGIDLVKSATPNNVTAAGQTVSYSFVVTNTGNVTLTGVTVTDPLPGLSAVSCPATTLAPGAATTCTATYTATLADMNAGAVSNTATALGTPPAGSPVSDVDSETVTAANAPAIQIVKTASPATVIAAGQTVSYSFVVTNTGNVTLSAIAVNDPLPGLSAVSCPTTTLAPGASTTCTATYIVTQADVNAGVVDNTASVRGNPPTGPAVSDGDSATVTATRTPAIDLVKSATPTVVAAAGQTVDYSFAVTNVGNVTLTGVGIFDPLPGLSGVTCPTTTLAPGASTTCTATYSVTQADVNAGSINNTATATGTPPTGAGPAVTDNDSETVTANRAPAIDIVKTATPTTVGAAGQTVNYSFVVTNTGNVTLTGVTVTDPLPGLSAITCPTSTLAPGASQTCTATLTVTQAHVNAGAIDNTASVVGNPPAGAGAPVTDNDSETVTTTRTPSIDLVKSASPNNVTAAGRTVSYSFVVTNTGNVTLTAVAVADPLPGLSAITCPATTLAPGASETCSATYTVTIADMDAGSINNSATVVGTPPAGAGAPVTDTDTETVTAANAPAIQIVKTANPTSITAAGQTVNYTFLVTNTGNVTLTGVTVADPLAGLSTITCPTTALSPGSSTTCTASLVSTQAQVNAGSIDNTASVTGTPPSGPDVTDVDSATVTAPPAPGIDLVKTVSPTTVTAAGQTVDYSFRVTNTGNVTLTGVTVTDPLPGLSAVTCPVSTLAPGASTTCTASLVTTQPHIDTGEIDNTATASGTPPTGQPVIDTDSAVVIAPANPAVDLVKTASPTTVTAAGQTVSYSFDVTNTGNVTLTGVGVSDPLPGLSAITCPASTLAPGASITCTAAYTTTQADVNAGMINNTATASGTPPIGPPVNDTDSEAVLAPPAPGITVVKSADPATVGTAGQVIAYTFLVTNTGNVTLTNVGVADPLPGLSAVSCPVSSLAPGASTTCTASYTVTLADVDAGSIVNTATASGTPPTGPAVTASDANTVPVTQTPAIDLVKTADPTEVVFAGDVVTYSFVVTNTGNVTLTGVAVNDPLPGLSAISCPATTLAPGVTTTCTATYSATQADIDGGRIDNTAIAEGFGPTGPAATDTASATVTAPPDPSILVVKTPDPDTVAAAGDTVRYEFDIANTGNVTLTGIVVSDPLPGLSAVTCPVNMLAPGEATTCSATYTVTQGDVDNDSIDNTVAVTGNPPGGAAAVTDDATATVAVTQAPSIALAKSANPTTVTAAGQTVVYSFLVTNTGNVTLGAVGASDALPGLSAITCPVTTLAPGASTTCSAIYTATLADMNAGAVLNTATASGTPPTGPAVTDTDVATVTAAQTPSIELTKFATPNNVTAAGQTVTYSFLVANTGNVTLSAVTVSDPLPGLSAIACPVASLAPSASTTCTATYTVTVADVDAAAIDNTASVSGTPPSGPAVVDADSETVTATNAPAVQIVKSATPTTITAAGDTLSYSFAVTNTGNVTLTEITVGDPLPGLSAISCPTATLAPAASTTCTATYTATQADVDAGAIDNTAWVVATPPTGPAVSDSDSETVIATRTPAIDVVKSATPTTVTTAGQTVTYRFLVTNTGNVTLTGVGVFDPLPGLSAISCPATTLAPGASTTCTATYTVTQADVNAGAINNAATASGTPPSGPAVSDLDSETVTATRSPAISVVKTALPTTVTAAGQTVTYSFGVTNLGNVTLTGIVVTDPLPGLSAVTCPVATLAPGASTTCTATYSVTLADMNAGGIDNTATVSGTPPAGAGAPVTDAASASVDALADPSVAIVKSASPNNVIAAGQTVNYSFAVTNTGNVTLSGVAVSDPLPGLPSVTCPTTTLIPGATTTCTASYTVTLADMNAGVIANTASVAGTPPVGPAVTASDLEIVTATNAPAIQITKTANPTTIAAAGQTVNYSFLVTNTGNVTLTGLAVTDPLPGLSAISCPETTLAPGASTTCTASLVSTQAQVDAGAIDNTASVTGTPPTGPAVTDVDTATVTAARTPRIDIVKRADPANIAAAGQTVNYSFLVTNTGNVTLTGIAVTDPLPGLSAISCPVTTLAPGASTTCTASLVSTQAQIDAGAIDNTASVNGTPPTGPAVTDTDSETVTATQSPSIALVKTATPNAVTAAGQTVDYSFEITNTGNVTLTGVGVSDPLPGLSGVACATTTLAPGVSTSCSATYVTTQADIDAGAIDNTATAGGTPPSGPAVTATASETVTAAPTPAITLDKTASPTMVSTAGQTVSYSFGVTNTGNVTLTDVDVSDPLPGLSAVTCPVATLAPGGSTTCTASYTVTLADVDAGAIHNTATASGTPPTGAAVTDSDPATVTVAQAPAVTLLKTANPTTVFAAGDTVAYSFLVTNTGNVSLSGVAVNDVLPGLSPVTCPTSTLAPAASTTCTATYTVTQADVDAGSIDNTAVANGTPPTGPAVTDTATATVDAVADPGIDVVKSATPNTVTAAGQTVMYRFVVTNTGNVTLAAVGVSDPLPGLSAVTCPTSSLAPGTATTCTATYVTTQADVDAGSIVNTATAAGTPPGGGAAVTGVDTAIVTATQSPSMTLVKSANPTTVASAGQTVNYSFLVTNTGNVTLTAVTISDPLPGLSAVSCPSATLAPAASTTCTASYTVTQADVDAGAISNTASASGTPPTGPAVTDSDSEVVTAMAAPSIAITKSATPNNVIAAGQTVSYGFQVSNTGNVTLSAVAVLDPLPGLSAISCPASTLAPGASTTCSATYVSTIADMNAGAINNTAATVGTPPTGPAVTATDSETVTAVNAPAVQVVKTATPTTVTAAGQAVSYSFVVTNTGNVSLTSVTLTDPMPGLSSINCATTTLDPGVSTTCTATYTATQADIDAGVIDNTASVSGTPPTGPAVTDTDNETVTVTRTPSITVDKTSTPTTVSSAGQVVDYSFLVTNTGNVSLTGVSVFDPLPGLSGVSCPQTTLVPGASTTCTATYTVTVADMDAGAIDNTATANGTPPTGAGPAVSAGDANTVTATQAAAITLIKTASPTTVSAAGQTMNYSFLVTNTGNVTLTGVAVTDPLPGLSAVSCPVSSLAPGSSTTCTAGYTVTLADVNAGAIANTATAAGTPPSGPAVTATDSETVTVSQAPAITLAKTASPNNVVVAGAVVMYSFDITNTGNVTLTGVTVTDPLPGLSPISCPVSTLDPGDATTCTATYTATVADMNAGRIDNTATASGMPPTGPAVTDTALEIVTAVNAPAIEVVKTASPASVTAAGQTVSYTFLVTNTGNVTLTGVTVLDPMPGLSAMTCPASTLSPGASTTCTATYTVTLADMDAGAVDNTATATGTPPSGPVVTDTDNETVTAVQAPLVELIKTADPATISAAGETITYRFDVTNTGNVTLTGVTVTDALPGLSPISCPATTLAPGATTTCTASYTATQADVDAGRITNTASVSATPPTGPAATDSSSVTVTATAAPAIQVVKTASPATVTTVGQTVVYSFRVTNTGNVTLSGVGVSDPLPGISAVTCPATTLAPGASTTCAATYTVTQADIDAGAIDNTATASGTPPTGPAVSGVDSETVTATQTPGIQVVKTASPSTVIAAGQIITYSMQVTNTGNVTLTAITVTDPLPGLSAVSCPTTTLAPAAQTTCTASYTATQSDIDAGVIANTVAASGTPPAGPALTDTDTEIVIAAEQPAVQVIKTASPTTVTTAGQTVSYSFVVINTGNLTLTGVTVGDPLPGLSTVSCPATLLTPAASMICTATYTVTQADIDNGGIANTASVTGTPPTGPNVSDTDTETVTATQTSGATLVKTATPTSVNAAGQAVSYSFLVTNTGNVTLNGIAVSDPLPGLSAVSCPAAALAPAASMACTATYTTTQADIDAGVLDNTATVTATPPSGPVLTDTDSETVGVSRAPAITLVKSASPTNVTAAGQTVSYSFLVTNTGNVTLTGVTVSDPLPGLSAVSCPATTLAPATSTTCTATYTITQNDVDTGGVNNTATASGTPPVGGAVTAVDSATVTSPSNPSVTLVKTANPTVVGVAGAVITYSFLVTNTGNVTLSGVTVSDLLPGLSTVACPATTLAPAASTTCTATYTVLQADVDNGSIVNTASVSATPPAGLAVGDSDTVTVTAIAGPAIDVVKTANVTSVDAVGDVIGYSFTVTNVGNVSLTSVTLTDPMPGLSAISCPTTTLAPLASTTCTANYTVTQADLDGGGVTNTATVDGTPPSGPAVSDDGTVTVPAASLPAITVAKSASPGAFTAAGQTISYSFLVTNTGNVTLTAVGVVDPLPGLSAVSCPATALAPGVATTCTATYTTTQADVDAGVINNTARASGTPPTGPTVTATDTATATANANPGITLDKSATPAAVTTAGQTVTYSFRVTNTGNVTLSGVVLSDPLPGLSAISCPATTLAPAASTTCVATYTVTQDDVDGGTITNTASVSAAPPFGPAVTATDAVVIRPAATPAIDVVKTANPTSVATAGQTIDYSFEVTNTGNVTLTGIVVSDPLPGLSAISCPAAAPLAPAQSITCTATYVTTQADADAGSVSNTVSVSADPPTGSAVTDTDTATVTISPEPAVTLVKTVSPTTVGSVGDVLTFTFLVTNEGNVTLDDVVLSDAMPGLSPVTCPEFDGSLAPGESVTCTATYSVTQTDLDTGVIRNSATAVGSSALTGTEVSSTGEVSVATSSTPALSLQKRVSAAAAADGSTVTYSLVATNTGNVLLTGVIVRDPLPGLSPVACPGFDGSLDPGESVTCTATYLVSESAAIDGRVTNVATVSGTTATGTVASATGTAELAVTRRNAIPITGSDTRGLLAVATLLMAAGLLLWGVGRRRRDPAEQGF